MFAFYYPSVDPISDLIADYENGREGYEASTTIAWNGPSAAVTYHKYSHML